MYNLQTGAIAMTNRIVDEWSNQLKHLLETKHLYQKVEVQIPTVRAEIRAEISPGIQTHVDLAVNAWETRPLEATMTRVTENMVVIANNMAHVVKPILLVTNVKLFCHVCRSSEVYYPLWARDISIECKDSRGNPMPRNNQFQLFFLAFQCENCHSEPEGFIVRRTAYRLHLEGRSPIEEVILPKYLPKIEARFMSDAIVGFNAGKKLAGLFYLRTFLEQFARRITGLRGRATGEEIMDAYAATLPVAHRDHMPSFRSLYEQLSGALHDAREDDQLFESVKGDIDRHFDIRRVFNIMEIESKPSEAEGRMGELVPPLPPDAS
jgi:hypothetical protein